MKHRFVIPEHGLRGVPRHDAEKQGFNTGDTKLNRNTLDTIRKVQIEYMKSMLEDRKEYLQEDGYRPKYLAVDEFAIHKGHSYATCVMDLETGEVLWVGKGRTLNDFTKFFEETAPSALIDVIAVAMDMNASYHKLVQENLEEILQNHHDLAVCYAMKEEMCELFQLKDRSTAERRWIEWFTAAKASEIPALVKFAELKEKRLPGLIAHAEHNISTGKLEGFNNRIKVSKRIGYGYRDDDFFFLLVRFISLPAIRQNSP